MRSRSKKVVGCWKFGRRKYTITYIDSYDYYQDVLVYSKIFKELDIRNIDWSEKEKMSKKLIHKLFGYPENEIRIYCLENDYSTDKKYREYEESVKAKNLGGR